MSKQKGISSLIGIIIIVAVAVGAFGGIFAYQYYSTPKEEIITQIVTNTNIDNSKSQNENTGIQDKKVMDETAGLPVQSQQVTEGEPAKAEVIKGKEETPPPSK